MTGRRGRTRERYEAGPTNGALMDFTVGGTFTRASTAYARVGSSNLVQYGSNIRRLEGGRVLIEGSRTGTGRWSEQIDNAFWTKTNCTVSANAVTAPDGTLTADRITTTTGGLTTSISGTIATAPTGNGSLTFYARADESYTASYLYDSNGVDQDTNFTVTTSWQRIRVNYGGVTAAPTLYFRPHAVGGSGTAGRVLYIWGVHTENGSSPSSYIQTTSANVVRSADSLTYASGSWNTYLATGNYSFVWKPMGTSTQVNVVTDFLSFGSANDRLSITNTDAVTVVVGSVAQVTTGAITWSEDQEITITVRPSAGSVTVSGATTGNGTTVGTAWTWPTAVTLRVGGRVSSTAEIFGTISNPVRV